MSVSSECMWFTGKTRFPRSSVWGDGAEMIGTSAGCSVPEPHFSSLSCRVDLSGRITPV